jgi:hypothetical protein
MRALGDFVRVLAQVKKLRYAMRRRPVLPSSWNARSRSAMSGLHTRQATFLNKWETD